jgi:hypothetical protein
LIQASVLSIFEAQNPAVAAGAMGKLESALQLFNFSMALPEFSTRENRPCDNQQSVKMKLCLPANS